MAHLKANHMANLLQKCIDKKAQLQGKIIHAQILTNGLSRDTFLSNRLVELYSKCDSVHQATEVFNAMPDRNVYSWNAIISAHCKVGNLDFAQQLLGKMPERNVVSWSTLISALVRSGSHGNALDLYYVMLREGYMPTHFTFASVLSACGSLVALETGRQCHGLVTKVGLENNAYVENALVGMYTKCGGTYEAIEIFNDMSEQNEFAFTAMMGGLVQGGSVKEALRLFAKMHRNGIHIDSVAVSSVLGACARMEEGESDASCRHHRFHGNFIGQLIHALVTKFGFEADTHVGNSLLDMYTKYGDMDEAERVFITLPEVNVVSWNVLMAGYGQKGDSKKTIDLMTQMQELGFQPDEVTYISQLSACMKSGDIEVAREMFDNILNPGVSTWNTILSGYCQHEGYEETIELFRRMQFLNIRPNRTTLAVLLSSFSGIGRLDLGKQVHAASTKMTLHLDMFVASGLVDMYSKCGHIEEARRVFDRMPERDVVSWNSMITGFALQSLSKEAFILFRQMRANGYCPTESSYASVISSCARLSSPSQGRQVHTQIAKDGFINDIFVGSALIDMYAKCGNVNEARQFFDCMPTKNIVSWNEMIHGYAQNGCGDKAVELFEHMLSTEEKPDSVTFIAILTACSHSGLVDEGIKFFNSMQREHLIIPFADHYTCIIDALGRAGRFKEVEVLVDEMPCKDDPIIWEVLLSACRVHGNVSMGKLAAEQLFRLDPQNPAPYVLLSNIYAAIGRWDDVSSVRRLMNKRGVVKDRGYSWIDDKDGAHAFMVDDDTRNVSDKIRVSGEGIHDVCTTESAYREAFAGVKSPKSVIDHPVKPKGYRVIIVEALHLEPLGEEVLDASWYMPDEQRNPLQEHQVGPIIFHARLQHDLVWTLEQADLGVSMHHFCHGRFDGVAPEPRKGIRSGHVPGSKCIPFGQMLDCSQMLLPANELTKRFEEEGISLDRPVVTSCRTGVTACILALGLRRLGKADVAIYDGSWTEWGSKSDTPVTTA